MIVAIHQPNYLPWLGFFHKLLHADVLVILDNVQFPRGKTYISRVAIKAPRGAQWLTVPVSAKSELQQIKTVKTVEQQAWKRKHLRTLEANYGRCPFFDSYFPPLSAYYQEPSFQESCPQASCSHEKPVYLADFNIQLIKQLADFLGSKTKLIRASEIEEQVHLINKGADSESVHFNEEEKPQGLTRLLGICQALGATEYLTGQGAGSQRYMEEAAFHKRGIQVVYQNFQHPIYSQLWGEFLPNLTVLDLLFNHGPESRGILLSE